MPKYAPLLLNHWTLRSIVVDPFAKEKEEYVGCNVRLIWFIRVVFWYIQ